MKDRSDEQQATTQAIRKIYEGVSSQERQRFGDEERTQASVGDATPRPGRMGAFSGQPKRMDKTSNNRKTSEGTGSDLTLFSPESPAVVGVYQILNKVTGARYISGSFMANEMLSWYMSRLPTGRLEYSRFCTEDDIPFNRMARDWALYGAESFDFGILEKTCRLESFLSSRTIFWLS